MIIEYFVCGGILVFSTAVLYILIVTCIMLTLELVKQWHLMFDDGGEK